MDPIQSNHVYASAETQREIGVIYDRAGDWAPDNNIIILTEADLQFNTEIDPEILDNAISAMYNEGRYWEHDLSAAEYNIAMKRIDYATGELREIFSKHGGIELQADHGLTPQEIENEMRSYAAAMLLNPVDSNIYIGTDEYSSLPLTQGLCITFLGDQRPIENFVGLTGLDARFFKDMGLSEADHEYFVAGHEIGGHCFAEDTAFHEDTPDGLINLSQNSWTNISEYNADSAGYYVYDQGIQNGDGLNEAMFDVNEHYRAIGTLYNAYGFHYVDTTEDLNTHMTSVDDFYVHTEDDFDFAMPQEELYQDHAQLAPHAINYLIDLTVGTSIVRAFDADIKAGIGMVPPENIGELLNYSDFSHISDVESYAYQLATIGTEYNREHPYIHYEMTRFLHSEGAFDDLFGDDERANAIVQEIVTEYIAGIESVTTIEPQDEVQQDFKQGVKNLDGLVALSNAEVHHTIDEYVFVPDDAQIASIGMSNQQDHSTEIQTATPETPKSAIDILFGQ